LRPRRGLNLPRRDDARYRYVQGEKVFSARSSLYEADLIDNLINAM